MIKRVPQALRIEGRRAVPPQQVGEHAYDEAILGAEKTALRDALAMLGAEQAVADRSPEGQPGERALISVRSASLPVARAMVERLAWDSWDRRFTDHQASVELGSTAARGAEILAARDADRLTVQARLIAHLHYANALRIASELQAADHQFFIARSLDSAANPTLRARYLYLLAVLRLDQSRFDEAERLCGQHIRLLEASGQQGELPSALLVRASVRFHRGRVAAAIGDAVEAAQRSEDPHTVLLALNSTASWCSSAGWWDLAEQAIDTGETLYRQVASSSLLRRRQWIRGRILTAKENARDGAQMLRLCRSEYQADAMTYEAAMSGLDLALAFAKLRQHQATAELAASLLMEFQALGVGREAIAALSLLLTAARAGTTTVALVEAALAACRRLAAR